MMNLTEDEMSRLPAQTRESLQSEEQRAFYDHVAGFTAENFNQSGITMRDPAGAFLGPYAPLQHTPALGRHFLGLVAEMGKLPGLPVKAREVAILVVGTKYQAAYELYAHRRHAVDAGGLSGEEVDGICLEEKPASLDAKAACAYDVARELVDCPGPLSDSKWKDGLHVIGKEGMTALIHFVGGYAYVSLLLNGFDCKIPDGESL